jgi:hypothetical protein
MAVSKVTVQLEGPMQGNVKNLKMYRVGTIKGAVILTIVGMRGWSASSCEFRRGELVTEEVAVNLSHGYTVTIVAPKGGN